MSANHIRYIRTCIYKHMRNITYLHIHIILATHRIRFTIYDSRFHKLPIGCFQMLTCSLFVTPMHAMADLEQEHTLARDVYAFTWSPYRGTQPMQSKLLQLTIAGHTYPAVHPIPICISLNTSLQIADTHTHIHIYIVNIYIR